MFFVFERHDLPTPEACVIRLDTSYIQIRTAENIALNVVTRAQGLLGSRRLLCPKGSLRCVIGFFTGQVFQAKRRRKR